MDSFFTREFTQEINNPQNLELNDRILDYIKRYIKDKGADNIVISHNELSYHLQLFGLHAKGNIFASVNNGVFRLESLRDKVIVRYQIVLTRIFIILGISALPIFFFIRAWWSGFAFFIVLGGLNFLYLSFLHKNLLTRIVKSINAHILKEGGKKV